MNITPSLLLLVPVIGAGAALLPLGRRARWVGVVAGVVLAVLAALLLSERCVAGDWCLLAEQRLPWVPALGLEYHVGVDGLGGVLLVLAGVLFAVGAAASADAPHPRAYSALWCALQFAVTGVFVAQDLVLFFLFWEAMLIPLTLLMWLWGGPDRRGATFRFLLFTMAGSALLLVGIIGVGVAFGTYDLAQLQTALRDSDATSEAQTVLAALFLAAFVVKLPLFPFHGWLPRAYLAAPVPVALVLSGLVAKTAVYGIVEICQRLFPSGMVQLAPLLVALAAVGTLYGALVATRQRDARLVIAYSSLSHLNLIGLGAFGVSGAAFAGVAVASVSHGLVVAALFLLTTMLALRTGSFDLAHAGGLGGGAPVFAALFTFTVAAAVGVPGTSGFAGEFLILSQVFVEHPAATIVATLVVIVSGVYGLTLLRRVFFGAQRAATFDLGPRERLLLVPLLVLILAVGLAPRLISDRIPAGSRAAPAVTR